MSNYELLDCKNISGNKSKNLCLKHTNKFL